MERTSVEAVEPTTLGRGLDRRDLSEPLGTTDVALNRYRLAPGERFSDGLHGHADQDEIFVVLAGEATFETWTPGSASDDTGGEAREVVVAAGEAVRFAPGEYQTGSNAGERDVVALALGAPRGTGDLRIPLPCPECDHVDRRATMVEETPALVCPDCGHESEAACPECASTDLRARFSAEAGRPLSVCGDCGVVSEG